MATKTAAAALVELCRVMEARRSALGISQTAAGRKCVPAISHQTISEMETGARNPQIETVERYCREALGLRLLLAEM
jgi:DNA-binding XRE family transcriptional regulator